MQHMGHAKEEEGEHCPRYLSDDDAIGQQRQKVRGIGSLFELPYFRIALRRRLHLWARVES